MKAITTKYLPYTNTQPARLKASDGDGNSVVMSWDAAYNTTNGIEDLDKIHRTVAVKLCEKMGWDSTHLVTGYLGAKVGFAHVWDDGGHRAAVLKEISTLLENHPDRNGGNKKVHLAYELAKANAPKGK